MLVVTPLLMICLIHIWEIHNLLHAYMHSYMDRMIEYVIHASNYKLINIIGSHYTDAMQYQSPVVNNFAICS